METIINPINDLLARLNIIYDDVLPVINEIKHRQDPINISRLATLLSFGSPKNEYERGVRDAVSVLEVSHLHYRTRGILLLMPPLSISDALKIPPNLVLKRDKTGIVTIEMKDNRQPAAITVGRAPYQQTRNNYASGGNHRSGKPRGRGSDTSSGSTSDDKYRPNMKLPPLSGDKYLEALKKVSKMSVEAEPEQHVTISEASREDAVADDTVKMTAKEQVDAADWH